MKNNKKLVKIVCIVLAAAMVLTCFIPAFSMLAYAAETTESEEAFIVNFTVKNGQFKENEKTNVEVVIVDKRLKFGTNGIQATTNNINVTLAQGAFTSGEITETVHSDDAAMSYTILFKDVMYDYSGNTAFAFDVTYLDENNAPVSVPLHTFSYNVTQIAPKATPTPTPTPTPQATAAPQAFEIDTTKSAFIQNYVVVDMAGNEVTQINPGQTVKLAFSVVDNRVTYLSNPPQYIRARMAQGAFINNDVNDISYQVRDVGTENGRKILGYAVVFNNVTYQGGTPDVSFDVSYINRANGQEIPLSVPYTLLTQNISQAVDDIPEPKVVLNSANYGGAAYIGKNFTLSTIATNTSEYVGLENVSVRVELPSGITMASGNSQALIGEVAKNGTISHNFELVVTGVENTVTSLPVNIVYDFEAYVKGERKSYSTQQTVAINIEQETKFEISRLDYMEAVTAGEETYITAYLINKGKTSVNNVTAEIQCDMVDGPQTTFVGNVMPGSEGTADIYFVVNEMGTASGKLIITYEDNKGRQSTLEKEFSFEVMEPYVWDEPAFNEPVVEEPQGVKAPVIIAGVVVVAVAGAAALVIRKKRKAKKLTEDEDEDI